MQELDQLKQTFFHFSVLEHVENINWCDHERSRFSEVYVRVQAASRARAVDGHGNCRWDGDRLRSFQEASGGVRTASFQRFGGIGVDLGRRPGLLGRTES